MATHSSILAGEIPWTEESMGLACCSPWDHKESGTTEHTHTMLTQVGFVGSGCHSWKRSALFFTWFWLLSSTLFLSFLPFSSSFFFLLSFFFFIRASELTLIGISLLERWDWMRIKWFLPLSSMYLNSLWVRMAHISLHHRSNHTYPQLRHLQWSLLLLRASSL